MPLQKLKSVALDVKRRLKVYRLVLNHPRTPLLAKALLGLAIGYILLPFDLIPDFIPFIGQLDDLIIVPLLVIAALKLVPQDILDQCRQQAAAEQETQ